MQAWGERLGGALLLLGTHCAVYDDSLLSASPSERRAADAAPIPAGDEAWVNHIGNVTAGAHSGGSGSVGTGAGAGRGGNASEQGSSTAAGDTSTGAAGVAGLPGAGGSGAAGDGSSNASSGSGGNGSGGHAGSGHVGGAADSISATDNNLSRGRPASADSQQTSRQHYAADANDGDRSTRWCAADYKLNHYWEVDLGQSYRLSSLRILWEKDASYLFKVESSDDHTSWSLVLDKTKANSAAANQQHVFTAGATGRYIRLTVTGGLTTTIWASFYELDIFGH